MPSFWGDPHDAQILLVILGKVQIAKKKKWGQFIQYLLKEILHSEMMLPFRHQSACF